jgi:cation diffusion facilitator family transporter
MATLDVQGSHEKQSAALNSVVAAVGLTGTKLVVGLMTGSLGILAEAAHSGLDLMAAVMTYLAVRISGRPADRDHPYGHGKVENLSAMAETGLLLLTCAWIIYEAVHRLAFHRGEVEVTVWSFAVMITSIVVDVSRSRMLYRAARRFNSQALEADALHFSTDIWSSAVVIVGLICVSVSDRVPSLAFLRAGDAVAAIFVALIVVWVSFQLGWRTVQALLDAAPAGLEERIRAATEALPGVEDCHNVRARYSGAQLFVDVHVLVNGDQTLREAHALTEEAERAIQALVPDADVTVHPEPVEVHHPAGRPPLRPAHRS